MVKLLKDQEAAHDLVQDAYLKLWLHKEKIDQQKAKAWLFTTAYHAMINYIKKENRTDSLELKNFQEPQSNNSNFELKELIDKSIAHLPEIQRSIILLRDLEGYNYKEIGEILHLNESQVKVYLFRARKKIKELIKSTAINHESN